MKERIGLDLDSVLSYTEQTIADYALAHYDVVIDWEKVEKYELECFPGFTEETGLQFKKDIESGVVVRDVPPHENAESATMRLREAGFEIWIMTSRPFNLEMETVDWLIKHNIQFDEAVLVPSADKCFVARDLNLKAFVEDRYDTLVNIKECCGNLLYGLYLVTQPWNKNSFDNCINRVDNVLEAVNYIIRRKLIYGSGM